VSFQEKHYEFIEDLNLEMGLHLAVQSFKNLIRTKHIGVTVSRVVKPNDIYLYMEPVMSILHRDFLTPFAEKITGKRLIPTYCITRKYIKDSTLNPHKDNFRTEVGMTVQLDGPNWNFEANSVSIPMKKGSAVIYEGNRLAHSRVTPATDVVYQSICSFVYADGEHTELAYDSGKQKDFYLSKESNEVDKSNYNPNQIIEQDSFLTNEECIQICNSGETKNSIFQEVINTISIANNTYFKFNIGGHESLIHEPIILHTKGSSSYQIDNFEDTQKKLSWIVFLNDTGSIIFGDRKYSAVTGKMLLYPSYMQHQIPSVSDGKNLMMWKGFLSGEEPFK
jgi:hypothetical protein